MDTKTLIRNLRTLFCNESRCGRKYKQVWLTEVEILGMYRPHKFILNVQPGHAFKNSIDEITAVINLLHDKAKNESRLIFRVCIHDFEEDYYCRGDDILVFEEENNCQ